MGQRHQAFLIAKVVPHGSAGNKAYYRCIAALHHQWCYGSLPVRAAVRMLSVVKNKENADIIREELRQLDGKYGRWGEKPKLPSNPCPYTSFLLGASWNVDFQHSDPYISGVSLERALLPADMGSSEGDNNDGITVIDVTIPEDPSYCFVSLGEMVPLTATQYIRRYYPVPKAARLKDEETREHEEILLALIAELADDRVVTLDMLAEAWPGEYDAEGETAHIDSSARSAETPIPSLADLSLGPAVERALSLEQTEDIDQLVWMPGKAQAIVDILKAHDPFPTSGIALLSKALRQISEDVVDLSKTSLSQEQISTLLNDFPNIQVLKLSHNPSLTIDIIKAVLVSSPSLRRVVALDTSLTSKALGDLITTEPKLFSHLDAFTHPLFLTGRAPVPLAFSFIALFKTTRRVASAALPFFTPAAVVQAMAEYLSCFIFPESMFAVTSETFSLRVLLSAPEARKKGQWNGRTVPFFPPKSLRALQGEGWFFAFQPALYGKGTFAFVKAQGLPDRKDDATEDTYVIDKILGLKDWLLETEKEGHPPVPASAVEELEGIFDKLREMGEYKLMENNDAQSFCQMAEENLLLESYF